MKFNAIFPTGEIGEDPGAIRAWAAAAEDLGFANIMIFDHVLGAERRGREDVLTGPYDESHAFHEAFVLLGYLAAVTHRIGLGTGVLVLAQRQTAVVAKQAAELQILAEGRFRLGVGLGWNPVEYQGLGVPFRDRARKLEEQITVLRELWSKPIVDFRGAFHRIERAGIRPLPPRPIPIMLGGSVATSFRRAARIGDGFLMSPTPVTRAAATIDAVRRDLELCGRPSADFPIELGCMWSTGLAAVSEAVELGTQRNVSIALNTMTNTARWRGEEDARPLASVDEHIAVLAHFMREFGSLARGG